MKAVVFQTAYEKLHLRIETGDYKVAKLHTLVVQY